jgi:hypothetical protein
MRKQWELEFLIEYAVLIYLQLVQNVVVELQHRSLKQTTGSKNSKNTEILGQRSIFVGWTGMPSQRRLGRGMGNGGGRLASSDFVETPTVEIDATFGRLMGLADKQKVECFWIIKNNFNSIIGGFSITFRSSIGRCCSY